MAANGAFWTFQAGVFFSFAYQFCLFPCITSSRDVSTADVCQCWSWRLNIMMQNYNELLDLDIVVLLRWNLSPSAGYHLNSTTWIITPPYHLCFQTFIQISCWNIQPFKSERMHVSVILGWRSSGSFWKAERFSTSFYQRRYSNSASYTIFGHHLVRKIL